MIPAIHSRARISAQPQHPALLVVLACASLMIGSACFYVNKDEFPAKPVPRPAISPRTLPIRAFRVGAKADLFSQGAMTGAFGVQSRFGMGSGTEAVIGLDFPTIVARALLRWQVLGHGEASGPLMALEAGIGSAPDYHGGLSAGWAFNRAVDLHAAARVGATFEGPYADYGGGLAFHDLQHDIVLGGAFRKYQAGAYGQDTLRVGLSIDLGNAAALSDEERAGLWRQDQAKEAAMRSRAQRMLADREAHEKRGLADESPAIVRYSQDGDYAAAAQVLRGYLRYHRGDALAWAWYGRLMEAQGSAGRASSALKRAAALDARTLARRFPGLDDDAPHPSRAPEGGGIERGGTERDEEEGGNGLIEP